MNFIFNDFNFILLEIFFASVMAFLAILAFSKTKKVYVLFFIISAFLLYLLMIFRVLDNLNIFILSEIRFKNVAVLEYIINYFPYIFISIAFIFLMIEKDR